MTDTGRLSKLLAGAEFPAHKKDLLDCAERAGADAGALESLRALPSQPYDSLQEVLRVAPGSP